MEFLLLIAALYFIGWIFDKLKNHFNENDPNKKFKINFTTQIKKFDDENIETIKLLLTGVYSFKKKVIKPEFVFRLKDITSTESANGIPLKSHYADWRVGSNNELEIKVVLNNSQDAGSGLNVSTAIKEFPIFFLDFPRKGKQRKILISVNLFDQSTGQLINSSETVWCKDVDQFGYMDITEIERKNIGDRVKLLMCCALADGDFTQSKADFITEWSKKYAAESKVLETDEAYSIIGNSYEEGRAEIESGRSLLLKHNSLENLKKNNLDNDFNNIFETCCKLVAEDGELHPEESRFIQFVADRLEIQHRDADSIYNKHMLLLNPVYNPKSSEDIGSLIGVSKSMSRSEVSTRITTLYKKYQALQVHSSHEKRQAAAQWMEVLSLARIKYLS